MIQELAQKILSGDRLSLARGITIIENDRTGKEELITAIYPSLGKALRIGVAGPPGVGKSTLTTQLAKLYRARGATVGIVAVDPTSSFTGGALLGDRIRMNDLFNDPDVFIRSMATRGSMGGLAMAATEAADLMDASGKSVVIFETVGIGQTELDIAEASDTVLLVLAPESGDGIQALKAGFMEIADIFVVNKSDREGAERTEVELNSIVHLREHSDWEIPVIKTIASQNSGIEDLVAKITMHRDYLIDNNLLEQRRAEHFMKRVKSIVRTMLHKEFWTEEREEQLVELVKDKLGKESPYGFALDLLTNELSV